MNLRQLINSNARVVKGYPNNETKYLDFTQTSLGNVIQVVTDVANDNRLGIKHMVMYMTCSGDKKEQKSIKLFDRKTSRSKKSAVSRQDRIVSTYTVAVSFSDCYNMEIPVYALMESYNQLNYSRSGHVETNDFRKIHPEMANLIERDIDVLGPLAKFSEDSLKTKDLRSKLLKNSSKKGISKGDKGYEEYQETLNTEKASRNELRTSVDKHPEELVDLKSNYAKYLDDNTIKELVSLYIEKNKNNTTQKFAVLPYRIKKWDKETVTIETLITLDTEVRVKCTCSQFYYTFAWYNADHQALIGEKPAAYIKLSNGEGSKLVKHDPSLTVRNKNKQPGLCKHLQFFISYLINNGIVIADKSSNKYLRSTYSSTKGLQKLQDVFTKSEADNTLNNTSDITTAEKEFHDALRDERMAYAQLKLFGFTKNHKKSGGK